MSVVDSGVGTGWDFSQGFSSTLMTDLFLPWVNDAKNNSSVLLGLVPETSDVIGGKFVNEPVKYGRNMDAMSWVRERGKIADPGSAKARPYAYRVRQMFFRAAIDGSTLRATKMDAVKYVDALEDIMQQGADDLAVDANRILHGDGSGRLCECAGAPAGNNIDIRLNQDIESVATCSTLPSQWLRGEFIGRRVAFVSAAGSVLGVRRVIAIVSETAGPPSSATITLGDIDGNPTPAPGGTGIGTWIVTAARFSANTGTAEAKNTGFKAEPQGIAGIFSDAGVLDGHGISTAPAYTDNGGTMIYVPNDDYAETVAADAGFQGIPVDSTHDFNQGIVRSQGGVLQTPREEEMQIMVDLLEETNNAELEVLLSGYGERSAYAESLTPEKRFTNTTTLRGGWTGLDFKGKTWVVDRHCLKNRIYFLGLRGGGFRQHIGTPFQPLDPLGPMWYRTQDDDLFHASYVAGFQFGVGIRNRCGGVLTDVARAA